MLRVINADLKKNKSLGLTSMRNRHGAIAPCTPEQGPPSDQRTEGPPSHSQRRILQSLPQQDPSYPVVSEVDSNATDDTPGSQSRTRKNPYLQCRYRYFAGTGKGSPQIPGGYP